MRTAPLDFDFFLVQIIHILAMLFSSSSSFFGGRICWYWISRRDLPFFGACGPEGLDNAVAPLTHLTELESLFFSPLVHMKSDKAPLKKYKMVERTLPYVFFKKKKARAVFRNTRDDARRRAHPRARDTYKHKVLSLLSFCWHII